MQIGYKTYITLKTYTFNLKKKNMCDAAWGGVSVRGVRMPRCLDTTPVSAAMYLAHCGVKGSSRAGAVGASLVTRISFRETTHRIGIGKQNYELYNTFTFIYIPSYIFIYFY